MQSGADFFYEITEIFTATGQPGDYEKSLPDKIELQTVVVPGEF